MLKYRMRLRAVVIAISLVRKPKMELCVSSLADACVYYDLLVA
jgi:hypothetical protein